MPASAVEAAELSLCKLTEDYRTCQYTTEADLASLAEPSKSWGLVTLLRSPLEQAHTLRQSLPQSARLMWANASLWRMHSSLANGECRSQSRNASPDRQPPFIYNLEKFRLPDCPLTYERTRFELDAL